MKTITTLLLAMPFCVASAQTPDVWTLQDCINHALAHNIQIQKNRASEEEADVALWKTKGALLPNLSFSTSQSLGYRPFEETTALVQNGQVTNTSKNLTYQGSYGINASWTVWNGGINQKNVEAQRIQGEIAETTTAQSELSIQEQIAQYYIQILYTQEAVAVNRQLATTAGTQLERGREMVAEGLMAQADMMQLESQASAAEYNIVSSQTQLANYKRQLKALLEIGIDQPFNVAGAVPAEETILASLPTAADAYTQALGIRPEIRSAELGVEAANLNIDIARRGYLPTVSLSASLSDSHFSASNKNAGSQMKTNLNMNAGVTIRVPIFDNRTNAGNVRQAKIRKTTSQLDLQARKTTLASTIEQYWLNANNNQQNYLAAKQRVASQQASYDLLNEQFENGLKNVVDLLQGRDNLISAQQDLLQSKYMALLNIQLLRFYAGDNLEL